VSGWTRSSAAICWLSLPSAQPSTIFERIARTCADVARRAHRCNTARSSSVTVNSALGRPVRTSSLNASSPPRAKAARHLRTVPTAIPSSRDTCALLAPGSAQASTIFARIASLDGSTDMPISRARAASVR
jgi:hypothetical protein